MIFGASFCHVWFSNGLPPTLVMTLFVKEASLTMMTWPNGGKLGVRLFIHRSVVDQRLIQVLVDLMKFLLDFIVNVAEANFLCLRLDSVLKIVCKFGGVGARIRLIWRHSLWANELEACAAFKLGFIGIRSILVL